MKPGLSLRPGVALALTPALRHALHLLQLSSLDLHAEIRNALDSNFLLEATDGNALHASDNDAAPASENHDNEPVEVVADAAIPGEMPMDAEWGDVYDDEAAFANPSRGAPDADLQDYLQANLHTHENLQQHLEWQVRVAPLDETETGIALAIVDAINDDGRIEDWDALCEQLCAAPGIDPARVESVLKTVQGFDPVGVGARDLRECLELQLQHSNAPGRAGALRLLTAPMPAIARRDLAALARTTGLTPDAVAQALELITTLQPHPGRPWQEDTSQYIEPDAIVAKRDGRWRVTLNPRHAPRIRINPQYRSLLRRAGSARDQHMLQQHLQQARSLIHGLTARNETLLRVAICIAEAQQGFLEYGAEFLRPLVLRDVALPLELHESTVSRTVANKYLLTPHGIFELKHFFSSHVNTTHGGTCSATAIQAMIKRLIAQEVPGRPLSDTALAKMLKADGIEIARRTVAKYRELLRIPPSHERRTLA